jgi:hypothetical protein
MKKLKIVRRILSFCLTFIQNAKSSGSNFFPFPFCNFPKVVNEHKMLRVWMTLFTLTDETRSYSHFLWKTASTHKKM